MIAAAAIPALVALLFKIVLLGYSFRSLSAATMKRIFFALLVIVALHNFVEFIGLNIYAGTVTPSIARLGFAYMALTILAVAAILHICLRLGIDSPPGKERAQLLLYVPAVVLAGLLLLTDKLVLGFQPFKNTVLRVPGPWFHVVESYMIIYLLAALALLVYGARYSRSLAMARTRSRLWLIGLMPTGLLLLYLIIANHYGAARLTSTIYLPITLTFFLVIATYAIHNYRLVDITYFIPWSKVRKRKTAFYRDIQALIAENSESRPMLEVLKALASTLQCPVALIGGPRPLLLAESDPSAAASALLEFPPDTLHSIDTITVAHEVSERDPTLYLLMQRHHVGAIVPLHAHRSAGAHWILFGKRFSEQVYTPLDFRLVETLFDRLAERFSDNLLALRTQLADVQAEVRRCQQRLATAWDELSALQQRASAAERENRELREDITTFERAQLVRAAGDALQRIASGEEALERHLLAAEKNIIVAALRRSGGDKIKAARLLGLWQEGALDLLLRRHGLEDRRDDR